MVADHLLVSGGNFAISLLLARALGIEQFGIFAIIWSIAVLLTAFLAGWLISPMMSTAPVLEASAKHAYLAGCASVQAVAAALAFALGGIGGTVCAAHFNWEIPASCIWLGAAYGALLQLNDFARRYCFTVDKARKAFVLDATKHVGRTMTLLVCLWISNIDLSDALAVLCIFELLPLTDPARALFRRDALSLQSIRFAWETNLRIGGWLGATAILQWASGYFVIFFCAAWLGPAAVGAITAVRNILAPAVIGFTALDNLLPKYAATTAVAGGGYREVGQSILREGGLLIAGILIWCAVSTIGAAPLVRLLFGGDYIAYSWMVYWIAAQHVILLITHLLAVALRSLGGVSAMFFSALWGALLTLVATIPAVVCQGLSGAMAVLLATNLVVAVMMWMALRRCKPGRRVMGPGPRE